MSSACRICAFLSDLFDLPFCFDLSFTVFFHSSVLMHPDLQTDLYDPDSVENDLPHSAMGRLVTYDDTHSLTGYEPNDMELINDTELNDTVSDELVYSQGPLAYVTPSSDQDIDGGGTLHSASCSPKHTENTPITAVWKVRLSVSRQCLSRPIERGNLFERATSIRLVLVSETRTVLTISFLQSPKLKKWSTER